MMNTFKNQVNTGVLSIVNYNDFSLITDKGVFPLSEEELRNISNSLHVESYQINPHVIREVIRRSFTDISDRDDMSEWRWMSLSTREFVDVVEGLQHMGTWIEKEEVIS